MTDNLIFEIFEKLIALDTSNPPGNERLAAEYLYRLFTESGIHAQIQELTDGRANIMASYGGEKNGEFSENTVELLLCGHLDVVPALEGWSVPPFQMTRRGRRLYGRGAADMKGGVAAMCAAVIHLAREKVKLRGRVNVVFVADEECSNLGMQQFLAKQYGNLDQKKSVENSGMPVLAVIGEPTELNVAVAHRGVLRDYIEIKGAACHAAFPQSGQTAVEKSSRAILALCELNEKLIKFTHEILPSPSMAVTMVEGYEKDNVIPGQVRILTDFRILPGMTKEECRKIEREVLTKIGEYRITEHFYMPGGEICSGHPYVKKCCSIGRKILKKELNPVAFGASCEQCFLAEKGIPTIICGPGSLKEAHTVDEYVKEEQLVLAEEYYRNLVMEFAGGGER